MGRRKQSRGICQFCNKEMTRGGLGKHLHSCQTRQTANEEASAKKSAKSENLYHFVIEDDYSFGFWLHLEVRGSTKLSQLDHYLRSIWLECCGHMSQFSFGGWRGDELSMNRSIHSIFSKTDGTLTHIYDFGTSSETSIKPLKVRTGVPLTKNPIFLMGRNNIPIVPCMDCGEPAKFLCMECVYEEEKSGLLCATHEEKHPHDDYGEPHVLYNSPRVGYCGELLGDEPPY